MSQSILSDDLYKPDFPSLGLVSTWFGVVLIGLTAVMLVGVVLIVGGIMVINRHKN